APCPPKSGVGVKHRRASRLWPQSSRHIWQAFCPVRPLKAPNRRPRLTESLAGFKAIWRSQQGRSARAFQASLAARGKSPAAFDRRCIPAPPNAAAALGTPALAALLLPQILPDIATPPRKLRAVGAPDLGRPPSYAGHSRSRELRRDLAEALAEAGRALPSGRLAGLGATPGLSPRAARRLEPGFDRLLSTLVASREAAVETRCQL